ncbi:MAG: SDR family oxidoreductase [Solirubrobacteraceae bacterium]
MTVLMTGFTGFLGSALLPEILNRTGGEAECLVQAKYAALAARRIDQLVAADGSLKGRITPIEGDITAPGLGLREGALDDVTEVWHLAAVYDLAVGRAQALRVNVDGTYNVLDALERCPKLERLQYVSTCYVSGRYAGPFAEDDLDVGAPFNNFYEETKHLAEVEVRRRMAAGLPATIYRPSIVVGDSRTGETQKYDGPYFILQWLLRQRIYAVVPIAGDPTTTRVNVVPRDFVISAVAHLSGHPNAKGRTYHVADPHPLTVEEMTDVLGKATSRKLIKVQLPKRLAKDALAHVPGAYQLTGIPAEAVDYFAHPTHYLTDHLREDLAGSGIQAPAFPTYVEQLVAFMQRHPKIGSAAMT